MANPSKAIAASLPVLLRCRTGREQAAVSAWSRLLLVGVLLFTTTCIGTLGHMLLGGHSAFDSFYFTLITLAAIGYGEPENVTTAERIFNTVLIIIGISLVAMATATIVQLMLELDLDPRRRTMERAIAALDGHYIVCGAGRVGRHIVHALQQRNTSYVVVEADADLYQQLLEQDVLVIRGDATQDAVLIQAGISRARGLLAAVGDHAVNAFIVLTGKALNPGLHIVARADDEGDELKMRKVGADKVIFPTRLGSLAMANALTRPAVASYLEWAIALDGVDLEMDEIPIAGESQMVGQTLADTNLRASFKVTVIAVRRADGTVVYNPGADTRIAGNDVWIVVGKPQELLQLRSQTALVR